MRTQALALALPLLAGLSAPSAHAQTTIDTTAAWTANGTQSAAFWGEPDTATYGQTFTAPANVVSLTDFSFYLTNDTNGSNTPYKAYLYAWNGFQATGSALYSSGTLSTGVLDSGFTTITTATPGAAVTPGQQYVAFFSTSGVQNSGPPTKQADFGYVGALTGATGGSFVYLNSGNDPSQFTTPGGWNVDPSDLAFKADFKDNASAAPEPVQTATLAFAALGLGVLLAKKARKSRASKTA